MPSWEALGVYQAASEIQGTPLERKQVRYGLAGEAAGSAISSLIGGFTTTAYPQNVGLLNLTGEGKLRTRTPVIIAAVLLLILGFVPKAGALLSVIPSAVVRRHFPAGCGQPNRDRPARPAQGR